MTALKRLARVLSKKVSAAPVPAALSLVVSTETAPEKGFQYRGTRLPYRPVMALRPSPRRNPRQKPGGTSGQQNIDYTLSNYNYKQTHIFAHRIRLPSCLPYTFLVNREGCIIRARQGSCHPDYIGDFHETFAVIVGLLPASALPVRWICPFRPSPGRR